MSRKANIWFFITTVLSLLIGIFQYGMYSEGGDQNAASMYVLVFGILAFLFWGVSFFFMSTCKSYFSNKKLSLLSLVIPTLLFLSSILFVDEVHKEMLIVLIVISGVVNLIFYLVTSSLFTFK